MNIKVYDERIRQTALNVHFYTVSIDERRTNVCSDDPCKKE